MKRSIHTPDAPQAAFFGEQAVAARGEIIFVSAQAAQLPNGTLLGDVPIEVALTQAAKNISAIAHSAGCTLPLHCVKATLYLIEPIEPSALDRVFTKYFGDAPPSVSVIYSDAIRGKVELEAILVR